VLEYQLHEIGVRHHAEYEVSPAYTLKKSPLSSHSQLLGMVGPSSRRVLDVGCGQGELGYALRQRGHTVTGIDVRPPRFALDEFIEADISRGLPPLAPGRTFDVILLADVLEHMADPLGLLREVEGRLAEGGTLLVSLPNAVHWSVRLQVATGKFDYTNKGILDRGHLRFFTKASAERLFAEAGLRSLSHRMTPVPWENVVPKVFGDLAQSTIEKADYFFARLRPNAFAYQHLFEVGRRAPAETSPTGA
jgi:SAM-dependent methyltransferase